MIREYTCKLLDMMDNGELSAEAIAKACLNYMDESAVQDMAESEGFVTEENEEESEDQKTETYVLSAHWASYLINGDESGLIDNDKGQADKFLSDHGLPNPVSCGESYFGSSIATGLAGDVCEYTFIVD